MANTFAYRLKKSFQDCFIADKFMLTSFLLSFFLNFALWGFLFWRIRPQEEPLYLHYNIYFGIDLIGPWYQIYYIPLSGLAFILVNMLISLMLYRKEMVISYFLMAAAVLCQFFLALGAFSVIYINL